MNLGDGDNGAPRKGTEYTVLVAADEQDEWDSYWQVVGTFTATNERAAKVQAFEAIRATNDVRGATLVAVPARSWKPETMEVKEQIAFS